MLVKEDKVVMFVQEVIAAQRTRVPKAKQVRIDKEAKEMATRLEIPHEELEAMLDDDRLQPERDLRAEVLGTDASESGSMLKWTTVDTWMSAIAELYNTQVSLGHNSNPTFRGPALNAELDGWKRSQHQRDQEAFVDRGAIGIMSGYTEEEFVELNRVLLAGCAERPTQLRTRLDILLGHFLILRGQSRRDADINELSQVTLAASEGASPCRALILTMSHGKTNKFGKVQYMGAIRHRDVLRCTMGALAMYLVWRWHLSGEAFPDFRSRKSWYRTKLLSAGPSKTKTPLSYPAQYEATWKAFALAKIHSVQKTHVMRGAGARSAELHGVSESQVSFIPKFSNLPIQC